jgi:hypothetical protein
MWAAVVAVVKEAAAAAVVNASAAAAAAAAVEATVRTGRYCSPRHQSHFKFSFIELHGIL